MPNGQKEECGHMRQGLIAQELQPFEDVPGSPGVCVNVEGRDGSSKKRCGFKEPHLHIGTGVPLVLTIHYTIVAQSR